MRKIRVTPIFMPKRIQVKKRNMQGWSLTSRAGEPWRRKEKTRSMRSLLAERGKMEVDIGQAGVEEVRRGVERL